MGIHTSPHRPGARGFAVLAAALLLGVGVGGCSGAADDGRTEVTVFAAASLTDSFRALATEFERTNPTVKVQHSFAGSQSLRTQIEHGARPAVFASANPGHMGALLNKHLVAAPKTFAHNELVLVVPRDNPAGIHSFRDLPRAERLVLAASNVPAGAYADRVIAKASQELGKDFPARVERSVVSRELHVRQTLQKVLLGEADAAIVYATDAAAVEDQLHTVAIPAHFNVEADYPIAVVEQASHKDVASDFVEFVRSDAGRKTLRDHGFRVPSERVALNL